METNLAQIVDATNDSGATYDTNVKYLLADKQILSWILKYTVEEFRDMDIPDIMGCIGDDIEIGARPVDAGLSNLGRVKGTVTEDNVPGEGIIYYDIRFTAYHKEKDIKILVNIEAQKSSAPGKLGYHLENRIIFYLARMISAQKQSEFFHSDFDSLKKVRSIWICMDNDETEDSIEEIRLDRKTVFGNKKNTYHTDLMKGIVVNVRNGKNQSSGESVKKSRNILIAMLEELVSEKDVAEKKRILADEYGMVMNVELEGRIQVMCNWSEAIRESIEASVRKSVEENERESIRARVRKSVEENEIESIRASVRESIEENEIESIRASVRESIEENERESIRASVRESIEENERESIETSVRESIEASVRENIEATVRESIEARSIEKGVIKERLAAIERMIKADATKAQIISYGYTEAEYAEAESSVFAFA